MEGMQGPFRIARYSPVWAMILVLPLEGPPLRRPHNLLNKKYRVVIDNKGSGFHLMLISVFPVFKYLFVYLFLRIIYKSYITKIYEVLLVVYIF